MLHTVSRTRAGNLCPPAREFGQIATSPGFWAYWFHHSPKKAALPPAHQRCRQIGGWRQERKSCGSHNVCCRNGLWQAGWRVFRPRRVPRHMVGTTHHFFFLFPSACWGSDLLGALAATVCRAAETANFHLLRPRRLDQKEDEPPRHGAAEEQRKPSRRERGEENTGGRTDHPRQNGAAQSIWLLGPCRERAEAALVKSLPLGCAASTRHRRPCGSAGDCEGLARCVLGPKFSGRIPSTFLRRLFGGSNAPTRPMCRQSQRRTKS